MGKMNEIDIRITDHVRNNLPAEVTVVVHDPDTYDAHTQLTFSTTTLLKMMFDSGFTLDIESITAQDINDWLQVAITEGTDSTDVCVETENQ